MAPFSVCRLVLIAGQLAPYLKNKKQQDGYGADKNRQGKKIGREMNNLHLVGLGLNQSRHFIDDKQKKPDDGKTYKYFQEPLGLWEKIVCEIIDDNIFFMIEDDRCSNKGQPGKQNEGKRGNPHHGKPEKDA